VDIYTLSKSADLPKTMGSVEVLENPDIIEIVKWSGYRDALRKRHANAIYIHQWEVIDGILYQRVDWGIS